MTRMPNARSGSHANRGMEFEKRLEEVHGIYKAMSYARVEKNYVKTTVTGNGQARIDGSAIVDYTGTLDGGRSVAFDAKDCAGNTISLNKLKPHQGDYLSQIDALGGLAFVLVRFERRTVYMIPIAAWTDAELAHKYGHKEQRTAFKPTGKASIRMDELPATWRVKGYDWMGVFEDG